MIRCKHCDRIAKSINSNAQHEIRCKDNPERIKVDFSNRKGTKRQGRSGNQYTKAKELGLPNPVITDETRRKISEASKQQVWTEEQRLRHSERMKEVVKTNPESYTASNRGRAKQIEYDGIKFIGQWELDFYKWAVSEGLHPTRPTQGFKYVWNGERTYFPDFYIGQLDLYIEVKGYETERDTAKWLQFPEKLRIIKEKEIRQIKKGCFEGL